ncbi:hypothetical protein IFM89_033339, partial [Coptis chinensis]
MGDRWLKSFQNVLMPLQMCCSSMPTGNGSYHRGEEVVTVDQSPPSPLSLETALPEIIRELSYPDTIIAWAAAYIVHLLQSMMPDTAGASEKGNEVCVKPMASRRLPRIAPSDIILPSSLGDGAQNSNIGDRVENHARRRCYIYYSSDEDDAPPITTRHPDPSLRSCSSGLHSPRAAISKSTSIPPSPIVMRGSREHPHAKGVVE